MIKTLIKNRLTSVLSGVVTRSRDGKVKKAGKEKIIAFALVYLMLAAVFAMFSFSMASMLAPVFIAAGADWLYFSMFILASVSVLFILSIFETKSELFDCKDNDLLLSMPIKPRDIVISRIFVVLIYNYLIQAIIIAPAVIVYALCSHNAVATIGFTVVSLFVPLFSTSLASGVGYLTALISRRLKNNSYATVAIAVVFLLVYFFGYSYLMDGLNNMVAAGPEGLTITKENSPLLYAIGASALIEPLNFITVLSLSILSAAVALLVISKSYIRVVTDRHGIKRAVYKGETSKQKSTVLALSAKEFSRFTSSAAYMLNSSLGIIFEIILGVVAVVESSELLAFADASAGETGMAAADIICPVMIAAIFLLSSMNMISASALSLEGKNLWILKSLPIKSRDVLIAKTVPHIVITSAASLITSILFMIASAAPVKYWAFFILTPIVANVFSAFFGLVVNVRFPKFDYQNEAQPVKQSMPVFIVMMVQMLIGIAVVFANFILSLFGMGIVAAILTLLVFAMLAAVFVAVLLTSSVKRYETFEP